MFADSAGLLIDVLNGIDVFALAFLRIIGFIVIVPVISGQTIPVMAKVGFAFCCAVVVMLSGMVTAPVMTGSLGDYFVLALTEFMTGFFIGFTVYLMFTVFYFVGQLNDYQIGFSMVSVYDPISQIQAPITGNLYYFLFLVFFVITGGFNFVLYLLLETYAAIPLGGASIIGNTSLLMYIVNMMTVFFEMGLRIAMPVIAAIIIVDAALGVLVKSVPQMNVFVVGMPLKLAAGLLVLYWTIPTLEYLVFSSFIENLLENIYNVIRGLTL